MKVKRTNQMDFKGRALVAAGTAVYICLPTAPAFAQSVQQANVVETITVVGARKRTEQQIDVPVSVSVLDAATLEQEGATDATSLFGRVPSLFYSQNTSTGSPQKDNAYLVIRGVGANPVVEPSVGVFVDGVYQPSIGFDAGFLDIERVEVLRGPQGTLFGRNTEAGAVNIITHKPGKETKSRIGVSLDKQLKTVFGSVSGPVVKDTLSLGLVASRTDDAGYMHNVTLGQNADKNQTTKGRLSVRFTPSVATRIDLAVDASDKKGRETGVGVIDGKGNVFKVADDTPGNISEKQKGLSLTIEHDFETMLLTAITGYRDIDSDRQYDAEGMGGPTPNTLRNVQRAKSGQNAISQELRLASQGSEPVTWLLGAYAYRSEDNNTVTVNWDTLFNVYDFLGGGKGPGAALVRSDQKRSGSAVFAQASYAMLNRSLELTGGLRSAQDRVHGVRQNSLAIPQFFGPAVIRRLGENDLDERSVTPLIQASYKWDRNLMSYATLSRGYKSGGFERYPTSSSPYLPIKNETADNFELGLKKTAMNGQLFLTASLFSIKLHDMQVPTVVINPQTGLTANAVANASTATSDGAEFELQWQPSKEWNVHGGVAYLKTKFGKFAASGVDPATGASILVDLTGGEFPNAPKLTYNLGASYRTPLSGNTELNVGARLRSIGKFHTGLDARATDLRYENPGYSIADLDIGVTYNKNTDVVLYVRNLTDKYYTTATSPASDDGILTTPAYRQVGQPRTIGLKLVSRF